MQQDNLTQSDAAFKTDCKEQPLLFQDLGARKVVADFSGGYLSSDGGILLLRQLDSSIGLTRSLSGCFRDGRDARFIEHELDELISQRVLGLAAGYEDLNDHNHLRLDPLFAVAVGKTDPLATRRAERDRGKALASSPTLNRLELGNNKVGSRAHKISADHDQIEATLIRRGVQTLDKNTREVVLDFDATDDPLHGAQEGRFFHGYYREYCYLPLYCFVGDVPLYAKLRMSDHDASDGTVEALEKIVAQVRKRCPKARIILRADSGFCREPIMRWCEENDIYYCLGLARNARLHKELAAALLTARERQVQSGQWSEREFIEFKYQTLKSWSRPRRVIGKAEILGGEENPRYNVTNLPRESFAGDAAGRFEPQSLYEKFYCARGEMENMIKQQQLDLGADRTSTAHLASNQLRLWFSTFAYFLLARLRALGLKGTELAKATAGSIRLKLIKIAAQVRVSVRRVHVRLCSACPWAELFRQVHARLRALNAESV